MLASESSWLSSRRGLSLSNRIDRACALTILPFRFSFSFLRFLDVHFVLNYC